MTLTRERVVNLIAKVGKGYPWKHELVYLDNTDAALRQQLAELTKEYKACGLRVEHLEWQLEAVNKELHLCQMVCDDNIRLRQIAEKRLSILIARTNAL